MTESHGARGTQRSERRLTPMSVPAFDPKVTPISTRAFPQPLPPSGKRHRGWTLLLVPPAVSAAVRTYEIRNWQMRLVAGAILPLLGAAFLGGAFMGTRSGSEESAMVSARLVETEHRLAAVGDTLRAVQIMATLAPATPASASAPSTRSRRRSAVAWEPPRAAPGVILPIDGRISSIYSLSRRHPILRIRRPHRGIDIVAPSGTSISAPAGGRVSMVERNFSFGLVVEIDHPNGIRTRYAHLRSALVSVGDQITRGMTIATVGSTGLSSGPHLHYEVSLNGKTVNPLKYVFTVPVVEMLVPQVPVAGEVRDSTLEEGPGM
ncbi:MAG: M23 family metallopeptidase [Anaerolineae bacterium]|nr:M23 family metallopeptidase [Gemmatimonadaceae bacterium]